MSYPRHPCAQSCSGYGQGVEEGRVESQARTSALESVIREVRGALLDITDPERSWINDIKQARLRAESALALLDRVKGEG